jgi:uncharacterized membrane protein YqjE
MLDSVRALLASAVALLHGRLELAGEELRREMARLLVFLFGGLAALFLLGLGIAFGAVTVMIAAREEYRLPAAAALSGLFLAAGGLIAYRLQRALAGAPRMLDATLSQLEKDHGLLDRVDAQRDQVAQQTMQLAPKIALAERALAVGQTIASVLMLLGIVRKVFSRRARRSADDGFRR